MSVRVEISYGELIDKITILEIKAERIEDPVKLANIRRELAVLDAIRQANVQSSPGLTAFTDTLRSINTRLWEIEDDIRDKERAGQFDEEFITLARSVYQTNDKRSAVKREINDLLGSSLIEEKSYQPY